MVACVSARRPDRSRSYETWRLSAESAISIPFQTPCYHFVFKNSAEGEAEYDGKFGPRIKLEFPVKVTMDIVKGFNIIEQRQAVMARTVARTMDTPLVRVGDPRFRDRLGSIAAIPILDGPGPGESRTVQRSDFVGTEIDRFFRLTSKSESGKVCIGEKALKSLRLEKMSQRGWKMYTGWKSYALHHYISVGSHRMLQLVFVRKASDELKGISSRYRWWYCTDGYSQIGEQVAIMRKKKARN